MADIKLTLSKDTCISREADYMEQENGLAYPLGKQARKAKPGCWVYFILRRHLVARAKAVEFEFKTIGPILNYDGENIWRKPGWWVKCLDMELPLRREGFRGFRYVREDEQEQFEEAFAWPEE